MNLSGFTLPPTGFTTVLPVGTPQTPSQNGPGSRQIYVAAPGSGGSDSNLGTIASPFATAAHGATFIRTGKSDQLLFNRGDTFTGDFISDATTGLFAQSGVSPTISSGTYITGPTMTGPILIGSYGTGARPIFRFPIGLGPNGRQGSFMSCQNITDGNNVVIQGLNFYAYTRDPANGAYVGAATACADGNTIPIWYALGGANQWSAMMVLIEDCVFNYFCLAAMSFQGSDNGQQAFLNPVTLVTRRNIVLNSYNGSGHSQGLLTHGIQNMYDIENFWDHNGWSEDAGLVAQNPGAGATIFNRNIYDGNAGISVQGTLIRISQGSIHARGSSNTQWRPGCSVSDGLFLDNSVGGFDIGENFGTSASTDSHVSQAYTCQRNVILQSTGISSTNATPGGSPGGSGVLLNNISNATINNNIVAQCDTGSTNSISVFWTPTGGSNTVSGNVVTNHITSKINTAYTSAAQSSQVDVSSGTNTVDLTGGGGPNPTSSSFVGDYWNTQPGGSTNFLDFLAACATRAGGTWPRNLSAYAVNDYVQAAFGVSYRS